MSWLYGWQWWLAIQPNKWSRLKPLNDLLFVEILYYTLLSSWTHWIDWYVCLPKGKIISLLFPWLFILCQQIKSRIRSLLWFMTRHKHNWCKLRKHQQYFVLRSSQARLRCEHGKYFLLNINMWACWCQHSAKSCCWLRPHRVVSMAVAAWLVMKKICQSVYQLINQSLNSNNRKQLHNYEIKPLQRELINLS